MKSVNEIVNPYSEIFCNFKTFNSVQSKVFNDVYHSDKSIIVSAPTGSGKTVIFELAIVRLLQTVREYEDFKLIYVAPIKALCSEKYLDWYAKFQKFGINCLEVTGDSDIQDLSELYHINLIITTPEKWDSLTRKWRDYVNIVTAIKLFMIDEVHLLNEDIRGPILETIVSRMKTIQYSMKLCGNELKLRFICASATIPNIIDLTEWIGGKNWKNNSVSHFFGEYERPVKLEKHILGFNTPIASFKFDMSLNYKLASVIRKYSSGKPTLIFCSSRKSVEMASAILQKEPCLFALNENHKSSLVEIIKQLKDQKLSNFIIRGIAYHHAGLTYEDRNLIETAFRKGLLLVLLCTSTLAMGVNLPAHLVVIKSTEIFINGKIIEYSKGAVLQMIGRAGRPQYDLSGVAVIMTQQKYVKKYENLMNGVTPIESHLHKHLAEHLNSEIVLQTITGLDVAMEWIRSTFLYVRACKSPNNYGLVCGINKQKIEQQLEEICLKAINSLEANELITKDQIYGLSIKATLFGRLMARYYLSFETIKLFRQIRGNENYLEIFNIIIKCKEFSEFTLRVNEKKILNDLNNAPIRFPISGKIKTNENKISCLIQAHFDNLTILDPSMAQDSIKMMRLGDRISKALVDYLRLSKRSSSDGLYKSSLHAITISKCYRAKLWENSKFICKQLKKIGHAYSSLLVKAGKTTLTSILNTEPQTLEMILNKPPPFGSEILEALSKFPNYDLNINYLNNFICVKIIQNNVNYSGKFNCTLIIGNSDNELLLYSDDIDMVIQQRGIFNRNIKINNTNTHLIIANLIHDTLVGVDETKSVVLNPIEEQTTEQKHTKKSNKRTIQTKLNLNNTAKKSKNNENSEEYESLLADDNNLFAMVSSQVINNHNYDNFRNSEHEVSPPENVDQQNNFVNTNSFNKKRNSLKRKLSRFEYNIKPKLTKNDDSVPNTLNSNDFPDNSFDIDYEQVDIEKIIMKNMEKNKPSFMQPKNNVNQASSNLKYANNLQTNHCSKNFIPLVTQPKVLSYYKTQDENSNNNEINYRLNWREKYNQPNILRQNEFQVSKTNYETSSQMNCVIDLTKKKEKNSNKLIEFQNHVDLTIEELKNSNTIDLAQNEPLDFSSRKSNSTLCSTKKVLHLPFENENTYLLQNNYRDSNVRYEPYSRNPNSWKNQSEPISNIQQNNNSKLNENTEFFHEFTDDDDLFINLSSQRPFEKKNTCISPITMPKMLNQIYLENSPTKLNLMDNSTNSEIVVSNNSAFQQSILNQYVENNNNPYPVLNTKTAKKSRQGFNQNMVTQQEVQQNIPEIFENIILPPASISSTCHLTSNSQNTRADYLQMNQKSNYLRSSNFCNFQRNINTTPHLKNMGNILNIENLNKTSIFESKNPNQNMAKTFSDYTNFKSISNSPINVAAKSKYLGMTKLKKHIIGSNISKPKNIFGTKSNFTCTEFKKASTFFKEIKDDDGLMPPSNYYYDTGISQGNSLNEQNTTNYIESFDEDDKETDKLLYNCSEEKILSNELLSNGKIQNTKFIDEQNEISYKKLSIKPNDKPFNMEKNLDMIHEKQLNVPTIEFPIASGNKTPENIYLIINHGTYRPLTQLDVKHGNIFVPKPKIVKEMNILDILSQISDGNLFEKLTLPENFESLEEISSTDIGDSHKFKDFFEDEQIIDPNQKRNFRLPDIPHNNKMIPLTSNKEVKSSKELFTNISKTSKFNLNQRNLYDEIVDKGLSGLNTKNQKNYYTNPSFKADSNKLYNQSKGIRGFTIRNDSYLHKKYSIDSDAERAVVIEKLKSKFENDCTYDENNFTKDLITCLISDTTVHLKGDLDLENYENQLKFSQNQPTYSSLTEFPIFNNSSQTNKINIIEDDLLNFQKFPDDLNNITEHEYYDNFENYFMVEQNELSFIDNHNSDKLLPNNSLKLKNNISKDNLFKF